MRNLILLLIFFSFPIISVAQKAGHNAAFKDEISDKDLDDARFNFKTGLFESDYLQSKTSRLSIAYHGLADIRSFTSFSSFEFIYAKKSSYSWFEFLVAKSSGNYGELTQSTDTAIDDESESLFSIGPGVSYQSTLIQNFISNPKIFESTAVYLLYHLLNEQFFDKEYKGVGLRADFAINYALGISTQFGAKFCYNFAPLKRAEEFEGESSSARSFLLSYMSLGLELSFFF